VSVVADQIEFESAEWGPARVDALDLDLLADFTGLSEEECLERLSSYTVEEMAVAWRTANPTTPAEIRRFYAETDLYLWELFGWNGSAAYEPYLRRIERLAGLWPPSEHPRALDYGCGIGTAAVRLAELGYSITVADIPGRTLEFAHARLARRGHRGEVIEIVKDVPQLPPASWNVLVSFDVLEHVAWPKAVGRQLVRALLRGGGASIVTMFDLQDERWPHHLPSGNDELGRGRWEMYVRSLGMKQLGDSCYRRGSVAQEAMRRLRYGLWQATGIYVERVPR
jgi:SAM-dependent methyltransferase